ncbi:MAG: DUF6282 family protein [Chloroflexota bacterium]
MALQQVNDIDLSDLIDLHLHAAPDILERWGDDIDVTRAATDAGLRAVLLKSHITLTADRASIAEKVVGGIRVFGGLTLNEPVGGFNPDAVEAAILLGAKEIWMPTIDAANQRMEDDKVGGLTIFADDGKMLPVVYDIIDMVREADIMLGTGHLHMEEIRALVKLARERGLKKIVVTHPENSAIRMPIDLQREIAADGVFFERCLHATTETDGRGCTIADIANQIRQVGVESTVVATDFGQKHNPPPVDGMRRYLGGLMAEGFTVEQLKLMAGENPAYLLGL